MKIRDVFPTLLFLSVLSLGACNTVGSSTAPAADVGVADVIQRADANLSDANLSDTNLSDTNLSDTNLSDTNLSDTWALDVHAADAAGDVDSGQGAVDTTGMNGMDGEQVIVADGRADGRLDSEQDGGLDDGGVDVGGLDDGGLDGGGVDSQTPDTADDTASDSMGDTAKSLDVEVAGSDATPANAIDPSLGLYAGWKGSSTDPTSLPPAAFVDITTTFGVSANASLGACLAVADVDGDQDQDFVFVEFIAQKARIHSVILQKGMNPKHVFSAIDTTLLDPSYGCSLADMNGDGAPDLIVGGTSGIGLYLGKSDGTFTDASAAWLPTIMDFAAMSVVPADLDGNGQLDLFVGAGIETPPCSDVSCGYTSTDLVCKVKPQPLTAMIRDRVLLRGKNLPLLDVSAAWKVPAKGTQTAAAALDIDGDGKTDILVGNDFGTHVLLHNQGASFATYGTAIGFHAYAGAMGWGVGDFNGDGLADLVLADSGPSPVYIQQKAKAGLPATFSDKGGLMGVWWPMWTSSCWAPLVADFDHDGNEDILIASSADPSMKVVQAMFKGCGSIGPGQNPLATTTSTDVLFMRTTTKGMQPQRLPTWPHSKFALVNQQVIDIDGDGDLDVVQVRPGPMSSSGRLLRVLRNDLKKQGKSIQIWIEGAAPNRDAVGAQVHATIAGVVRKRWLASSGGFGGTRTQAAHFGLGNVALATNVKVLWPNGKTTLVGTVKAGALVQVQQQQPKP